MKNKDWKGLLFDVLKLVIGFLAGSASQTIL